MSKITNINLEKWEDRRAHILPTVWERQSPGTSPLPVTSTHLVKADHHPPPLVNRPEVAMVMIRGQNPGAIQSVVRAVEAGARVYVLVGPDFIKEPRFPGLQSGQNSQILIRRMAEVPISAMWTPHQGHLWIGKGENTPWYLNLNPNQHMALRSLFIHLFWHHSTEEGWSEGTNLKFRPAAPGPFPPVSLPEGSPIRWLPPTTPLEVPDGLQHLYLNTSQPSGTPRTRLWTPPSGQYHPQLAEKVQAGTEVVWTDLDLPDLAIGSSSGHLQLPGKTRRLHLHLTLEQSADFAKLLTTEPQWSFRINRKLGQLNPQGQVWLPNTPAPHPLQPEQVISVGEIKPPSIRETETMSPSMWPSPHETALSVRYQWVNVPPQLPGGSQSDALVTQWAELDRAFGNRLKEVRTQLERVEEHQGTLRKRFVRLLSSLLGHQRQHGHLISTCQELESVSPSSAGTQAASTLLEKLQKLEREVQELAGHLKKEEENAREDEERERQQGEWKIRVEKARLDHQELSTKKMQLAGDLEQANRELEATIAAQAKLHSGASAATAPVEEEKTEASDLSAKRKGQSDQVTKLGRELQSLTDKIKGLKEQASEPFEFRPKALPLLKEAPKGGRFVPNSGTTPPPLRVPEEDLPLVGTLWKHKGNRYLAIEAWEQLDIGEGEASRLKAKLVTVEAS